MQEIFLLGAGASVEAKVPDSVGMTEEMVHRFSMDPRARKHNQILRFVIGGLLFQKGGKGQNPFEGINIEDLFNTVQLLAKRNESELGPFISSWHPLLDEFEAGEVSSYELKQLLEMLYRPLGEAVSSTFFGNEMLTTRNFSEKLGQGLFHVHPDFGLQEQLSKVIKQVISSRGGEVFHQTNTLMIQKLIELVWIEDASRIEHLKPLINYAIQNNAIISTLNYDNSIELAGQSTGVPVDTGFEAWSKTEEFTFRSGELPLIKLHGSIDWALSAGQVSAHRPSSYQIIRRIDYKKKSEIYEPAIIFGGKNKLTAKGPFLSLLRAFEKGLTNSSRLTAIGYSFRDEHVNEYIGKWMNRSSQNRLRVINPDESVFENEFIKETNKHGADRIDRINELASIGIKSFCQNSNA